MCGIFGVWGLAPISDQLAHGALRTRGPDDAGCIAMALESGVLQLFHTRLAIQDLTPAGHQPMASRDGHCVVIFNGEIYNVADLREQLIRDGVVLRSHSDTEIIVEGYVLWGDALWPKLNGIFAIALYDHRQRELILARDRFGVKPLLWYRSAEAFAFGSELSVFRDAGIPAQPCLDPVALESFWLWGAVQAPHTLVDQILVFPPGCRARWRAAAPGDTWQIQRFAAWPDQVLSTQDVSYSAAVEATREALERSVARQLVADVPVGAFLSGGLDSASIVALMRAFSSTPPETFSLGFEQPTSAHVVADERDLAREVARELGTSHHEVVITAEEAAAAFPEFCEAIDQPSVDGFNTFLVARAARQYGLRVAVSGLGGDELLAGYPVFHRAWQFMQSGPQPWGLLQARLPWRVQQRLGWQSARFHRGAMATLEVYRRLHRPSLGLEQAPCSLLHPWQLSAEEQRLDPVAQLARLELRGYLANTLLRDTDAVTMHHALELRVPFLDNDLADLLLRMPSAYKVRAGCNKPLLLDAMATDLPGGIQRAPKQGFELPYVYWLSYLSQPRLDPACLGAPWPGRVRRAANRFRRRPAHYHGWWQWQVLARWLERWPELLSGAKLATPR